VPEITLARIALYESLGYLKIPPYEPYQLVPNTLCYEKALDIR
jgi:hypothetical protein